MNLLSLLAGLTRRDPHATIAVDAHPDKPVHVSRAELWRRTLQLRADLATAGVGRGDAVALWLPAWSDVLTWHIATASLGAHAIGLAPAHDSTFAAAVVERARPKVVALPSDTGLTGVLREAITGAAAPVPAVAVVAGPHEDPPIDPSGHDIGGGAWLPSAAAAGMPMPKTGGDELAVAFPAAGSAPVAFRESAVVRHALACAGTLGIRADDVVACTRPLSEPLGFATAAAAIAGGGTCLLQPVPGGADTGDTVLTDVARFDVTHVVADDEAALRLAGSRPGTRRDLSSWRRLVVVDVPGGAAEAAAWAEKELGTVVTCGYRSPAVLAPAALWPPEVAAPLRWSAGGHPVSPRLEVRVVDPVTERPVSEGERGELQFRGAGVVDAYLGEPHAVPGTADGWLASGDLGTPADDGGFTYAGRVPDGTRAGRESP
ncbi:AMP-binding protein [Qaidamihabitans albus]|uniref:AMP-binding protein n=1 Tax=Qaidamihabitans albus TaxID=2795733 RepID=UPI0018F1833D|nr:AMP-binding protein [Qaidamihabitans albus]